ncbi:MAG: hypothetical protein KGH75_01475 [Rhodospirillales bacterium]|nr:hypothetical protein [Rhodospirillales bacterium]
MITIYIKETQVGDSLTFLPTLDHFAKDNKVRFGPIFNSWVLNCIPKNCVFDNSLTEEEADYDLVSVRGWSHAANNNLHLIQGYFIGCDISINTDYTYSFSDTDYQQIDIVISPFSSTKDLSKCGKSWEYSKWIDLMNSFPKEYTKTVVGALDEDYSWVPYKGDIQIVAGKSVAHIASLLKTSKLFISIDAGISHLAHLIRQKNHVLLYPHVGPVAENFFSKKYTIYNEHSDIRCVSLDTVQEMCNKVLVDFNHSPL